MGGELSAEDLTLLKSGEACIVRNPLAFSYGETELERTSFVAGERAFQVLCKQKKLI